MYRGQHHDRALGLVYPAALGSRQPLRLSLPPEPTAPWWRAKSCSWRRRGRAAHSVGTSRPGPLTERRRRQRQTRLGALVLLKRRPDQLRRASAKQSRHWCTTPRRASSCSAGRKSQTCAFWCTAHQLALEVRVLDVAPPLLVVGRVEPLFGEVLYVERQRGAQLRVAGVCQLRETPSCRTWSIGTRCRSGVSRRARTRARAPRRGWCCPGTRYMRWSDTELVQ